MVFEETDCYVAWIMRDKIKKMYLALKLFNMGEQINDEMDG